MLVGEEAVIVNNCIKRNSCSSTIKKSEQLLGQQQMIIFMINCFADYFLDISIDHFVHKSEKVLTVL